MSDVLLTVIETGISLVVEGIILGLIFQWISAKSQEKSEQNLKEEMNNLEKQNRFDYEHIIEEIRRAENNVIFNLHQTDDSSQK